MKTGLVLEGGAKRGVFTAGVLDYLLEQKFNFSYVIGVSAGAGIAVNFVAGQAGRSKKVIMHENATPYYGFKQLRKCRHFLNLETFVVDYAYEEIPLDFQSFHSSETQLECVGIDCESGEPRYFSDFSDNDTMLNYIKASCAVPFACAPVEADGRHYLDGSIADSIPVERALSQGCDKVFVILTRPEEDGATDYSKMKFLVNRCYKKKYPQLCEALFNRKSVYDAQMERIKQFEKEGRVFILRPETTVKHFERDEKVLEAFYKNGYDTMKERFDDLKAFFSGSQDQAESQTENAVNKAGGGDNSDGGKAA